MAKNVKTVSLGWWWLREAVGKCGLAASGTDTRIELPGVPKGRGGPAIGRMSAKGVAEAIDAGC